MTTERPTVNLSVSELDSGSWVIFELPGFTTAASGTAQNSLDALRKASATSYYKGNGSLWVKLVSSGDVLGSGPNSGPSGGASLRSAGMLPLYCCCSIGKLPQLCKEEPPAQAGGFLFRTAMLRNRFPEQCALKDPSLAEGNANFSIVIVFRYADDLMVGRGTEKIGETSQRKTNLQLASGAFSCKVAPFTPAGDEDLDGPRAARTAL